MKVPAGLKKRLQTSIQSLTPIEAGRLYAIYVAEAFKKDIPIKDYAPAKELWATLDDRLAKARGKPGEADIMEDYNAVVFLSHLHEAVNDGFQVDAIAIAADAYKVMTRVRLLMHQDSTSEVVRRIRASLTDEFPKPISKEDYEAVLTWATTDSLLGLDEVASDIVEAAFDPDGTQFAARFEAYFEKRLANSTHDEAAAYANEKTPSDEEAKDALWDEVCDTLATKLETGELVGGDGLTTPDLWAPVLVKDGLLPAWTALRLTWQRYVTGRGLQGYVDVDYSAKAQGIVSRIVNGEGQPIEEDALLKLAGDFYQDCRRRTWGKGLNANAGDLDTLLYFLLRSPDELTHIRAPDWGRVDWDSFAKVEVDSHGDPFELTPVATRGSLDALDPDFRHGATFAKPEYVSDRYYPASNVKHANNELSRMVRMLNILDQGRQPFTFDRRKEGMLTMAELTGFKVMTALEQAISDFRRTRDFAFSVRHAVKIVTDRYFAGLDILLPEYDDYFKTAEANLAETAQMLSEWHARLKEWPWEIDADDLEPGEPEVDEDFVKKIVDDFLYRARRSSRIKNADELLFGRRERLL